MFLFEKALVNTKKKEGGRKFVSKCAIRVGAAATGAVTFSCLMRRRNRPSILPLPSPVSRSGNNSAAVQRGTTLHDTTQRETTLDDTTRHDPTLHDKKGHGTIRDSRFDTEWHLPIRHDTQRYNVGRNDMVRHDTT